MKMDIFNGLFWGILLITIGVLLAIKYIFNIDFHIGRIVLAVLLIYIGIRILMGKHNHHHWQGSNTTNTTAFSNQKFSYSPEQNSYSCEFGSSMLDLSNVALTENKTLNISVAFGEFIVKVNKDSIFEVHSSTAFGSTQTPDGSANAFGQRSFFSHGYDSAKPHFILNTNVAFGSMKIINY